MSIYSEQSVQQALSTSGGIKSTQSGCKSVLLAMSQLEGGPAMSSGIKGYFELSY